MAETRYIKITNRTDKDLYKHWHRGLLTPEWKEKYDDYKTSEDFLGRNEVEKGVRRTIPEPIRMRPFFNKNRLGYARNQGVKLQGGITEEILQYQWGIKAGESVYMTETDFIESGLSAWENKVVNQRLKPGQLTPKETNTGLLDKEYVQESEIKYVDPSTLEGPAVVESNKPVGLTKAMLSKLTKGDLLDLAKATGIKIENPDNTTKDELIDIIGE